LKLGISTEIIQTYFRTKIIIYFYFSPYSDLISDTFFFKNTQNDYFIFLYKKIVIFLLKFLIPRNDFLLYLESSLKLKREGEASSEIKTK